MHISRFQLKLTLIFLLVLLIPAIFAALFTRYIVTVEKSNMDIDQKVEAVLQEASNVTYDIIEGAEGECQSLAEAIANDREFLSAYSSGQDVGASIAKIVPASADTSGAAAPRIHTAARSGIQGACAGRGSCMVRF